LSEKIWLLLKFGEKILLQNENTNFFHKILKVHWQPPREALLLQEKHHAMFFLRDSDGDIHVYFWDKKWHRKVITKKDVIQPISTSKNLRASSSSIKPAPPPPPHVVKAKNVVKTKVNSHQIEILLPEHQVAILEGQPKIRLVIVSDTHNYHQNIAMPPGDVLIHAGDFTVNGTEAEIIDFKTWLQALDYKKKNNNCWKS